MSLQKNFIKKSNNIPSKEKQSLNEKSFASTLDENEL